MVIEVYHCDLGWVRARVDEDELVRRLALTNSGIRRGNNLPGSERDDWLKAEAEYREKKAKLRKRVMVRAYFLGQARRRNGMPGSSMGDWCRAEREELDGLRLSE